MDRLRGKGVRTHSQIASKSGAKILPMRAVGTCTLGVCFVSIFPMVDEERVTRVRDYEFQYHIFSSAQVVFLY